ncbi:MAG: hypothetical protein ACKVOA_07185 [Methylophilaceae bacterium]
MTKLNLTKGVLITGLVIACLTANAQGFNKTRGNTGIVITPELLHKTVAKTKPDQFALSFGMPDTIETMRDAAGNVAGVVWVYRDAVADNGKKMDANFMIVNGELKYVTLTTDS